MSFKFAMIAAGLVSLLGSGSANALVITSAQSLGAVPSVAGTGLLAKYFKFNVAIGSLSQGDSLVTSSPTPTATFTALDVCFPSCNGSANDGTSLASYVGTHGTNLVGDSTLGAAVTQYSGYIAIPTATTYSFGLFSDDGSILQIGGTTIVNDDGQHPVTGSATSVTFQSAGLYSFYVDHFENGGGTGVTVLENNATLSTSTLYSSIPASASVPEPASMALVAVGVAAVGAVRRRRRDQAASAA